MTPQQLADLKKLASRCKNKDGSTPNLYVHILEQPRAFPTTLLWYEQAQLRGFLSAYFFYDDAVEISLLIDPAHRKQGIARELMRSILPLIELQSYFKLFFSIPAHTKNPWLETYGYTYLHSEYCMERHDLTPVPDLNSNMIFRTPTAADIQALCQLDELCFPQKRGDNTTRFEHLLRDKEYELVVAIHENTLVGKAHLRWGTKGATLSDIAITPEHQGKGFGTYLIKHCINLALSCGKPSLNLDVETHNTRALRLYTRLGFVVHNACDFWSIDINQIHL
jgi:ribosomal protein S18 acetylase RimI-like enzyme